ncbi:MAG: hypothetical protein RLY86_2759 [Pseudomonadota bacterium]
MSARARRNEERIVVGQRYRKPGSGLWEVIGMNRDGSGHLHVRLRRIDDPLTEKTIAAAALLDPRAFQPAPSES